MPKQDKVEKRKVTMRSLSAGPEGTTLTHEAVDYVPVEILDSYVADARTRWQAVEVSDEVIQDNGPTVVPATLDHPQAGKKFSASSKEK